MNDARLHLLQTVLRLQGLSLHEASRRAGVPYERAQRLMRGQRQWKPGELDRLLKSAGVHQEDGKP